MNDSIGEGSMSTSSQDRDSAEKPHPSEYLEFVTTRSSIPNHDIKPHAHFNSIDPIDTTTTTTHDNDVRPTASNDDLFRGLRAAVPGLRRLSVEARTATEVERKMSFLEGCRLYPKAIAWSLLLSCTIIQEGYDTTLINSFFAFPIFRRTYGTPVYPHNEPGQKNYQISPAWQSGLTNGMVVGEIIGLFLNGFLTDLFGYHKTMIWALVWMSLFVFLAFFAIDIKMLLAAQVLCGIPWGIFQTLCTTYAAEVMPVQLRAYLLSNVNMCWLIGQIIGVGTLRGLVHDTSKWSYKLPFALQWAFAVPILIGVCFAPESPWWLVRHEKYSAARKSLLRLTSSKNTSTGFNVDETVAMMRHTNEVEKYLQKGGMSYWDCFKGTDGRRTEIVCMVWITQAMCGSTLTGYAAYFYEQAGFNTANSFTLAVGMYGLAIIGGIISWALLPSVGRRRLYLVGLVCAFITLMVTGAISILPPSNWQSWTVGSLVIFLTFVYDMTIGPVCYILVAEIPSTRLRVKTVVLARVAYNVVSVITNIVTPRFLNPTALNWRGKTAFLYAATTLICMVWCYWRLPEPKGLSYFELDILFEKKAKARKFKEFQVNLASTGYFSVSRNDTRSGSVW